MESPVDDDSEVQDDLFPVGIPFTGQAWRSFEITGLANDQTTSSTGMKEDLILLSWLVVLLRTREDRQACFDWAYTSRANWVEHELVNRRLSTNDLMTTLESSVSQVSAAISKHMETTASSLSTPIPGPMSLLLNTCSLSQSSEDVQDEVSVYCLLNVRLLE